MELQRTTAGRLPLLAGGEGPPLLHVGGLLPVAGVDAPLVRRAPDAQVHQLGGHRRLFYANRRQALPRGITIAEIAAEHAEAIRALSAEPVDVVGVSTGGSIAQQLAADHPEVVRRLVLVSTGCRLTPRTRRLQARVAEHVRAGRPDRALAAVAVGLLLPGGEPLAYLAAPLASLVARRVGDLDDLAATIEAEDAFDLHRAARPIDAETLIVAGARDRFYPRSVLEETQRLIPGSMLHVVPRRGHVTVTADRRANELVRVFLQEGGRARKNEAA